MKPDEVKSGLVVLYCSLFCFFSHHPVQHVCKQEGSTDAWRLFALIVASCANSNCFNLLVVWQCTTLLSLHLPIHGEHVVWLRCSLLALELLCDTIAVDCWFVMRDVCVCWWWDYFQLRLLKLSVCSLEQFYCTHQLLPVEANQMACPSPFSRSC